MEIIIKGANITSTSQLLFNRIHIKFTNLAEWIGLYDHLYYSNGDIDKPNRTIPIKANYGDYYFTILSDPRIRIESIGDKTTIESIAKTHVGIQVESRSFNDYKEYFEIINVLQNLLTLAMHTPIIPSQIHGIPKSGLQSEEAEVFFKVGDLSSMYSVIPKHTMLFTLADISDRFNEFINLWFESEKKLTDVYDLYLTNLRNWNLSLDSRILNLALSLEAFHRNIYPEATQMPREKFDERINEILSSVSKNKIRKWLKGKLKWSNELSLEERLRFLLDNNYLLEQYINRRDFGGDLVRTIVDKRNYLAHHDPKLKSKAATGEVLLEVIDLMEKMLEISFMHYLEFPQHLTKIIIAKCLRY